ncbi:DEAD/DEAH box helicase [Methanothermobacter sp. K4]|uniref:DEAD/DEAH box helicase n=1 Tax=Methanothermobacter sp. K4 TaxID=2913262 RepID=UPI001EDB3E4F|nr:DEAD/DEAH box helicase [Methanothermobacter sp. K4]MCG2827945.1 DEAD/DEAH box helicase [Methanothermobacter sp. K4]
MARYIEHPLIKPGTVEARTYQQLLAADILRKGNSMIVAPTALGKTIVAVLVAAERLQKYRGSRVLILSPSKPLAIQHEESFREFLLAPCTSLTGSINPEERVRRWNESRVISATPQTIESDVLAGRYDLSDVSLLVFDECHRAVGSYSYVFLASSYMQTAKNPLILGLTASPGADEDKIKSVCSNLFLNEVVVKTEKDPDVRPYLKPIKIEWVRVKMKPELEEIRELLKKVLKTRLKMLKNLGVIESVGVGKRDLLKARGRVQNRIARSSNPPKSCYRAISLIAASINVEHALELLETQGIHPLLRYLTRFKKKNTRAARSLLMDPDFTRAMYLTRKASVSGIEHPKLDRLIEILRKELEVGDSRIIVFTQFRDTLEEIYQRCVREGINAVKFYGQNSRSGEKDLTQKQQRDIIRSFRMGNHDVLLSTSVAEEGIDIPSVDLVVMYEPVPSEIRMIQRRGRTGRRRSGRMVVLMTEKTRDEAYYYSSIRKEKTMKESLRGGSMKIELTPLEFPETDGERPFIYVDSREVNSRVLRELRRIGVDFELRKLSVGDYQVSDDTVIERKTTQDFLGSIMDKRLYRQAREMVENFKRPVMIIEGEDLYSGFMNPDAVRGALASVAVDFGIPIIPTRSPADTAAMIRRIALREQREGKPDMRIRTDKKPVTLQEKQLFIVESLPYIGSKYARRLLESFGSVEAIMNASEKELMEVEGIGKRIASEIRKVIEAEFKDSEKIRG